MTRVVASAYGSTSLEEAAARAWNNRGLLGAFVGTTMPLDEEHSSTGPVPTPLGGSVEGDVSLLVRGPVPCGGTSCHTIVIRMTSKDDAIGVAIAKLMNDMFVGALRAFKADEATMAQVPKFRFASPGLSVDIERLVDARTGLPHGEKQKSVVDAVLTLEGLGERLPFRLTQTQTSRFEYE